MRSSIKIALIGLVLLVALVPESVAAEASPETSAPADSSTSTSASVDGPGSPCRPNCMETTSA